MVDVREYAIAGMMTLNTLSGSRLYSEGTLWLQGVAVFTFGLMMSSLSYSTWLLYTNVQYQDKNKI